jgi:hypothetical protein
VGKRDDVMLTSSKTQRMADNEKRKEQLKAASAKYRILTQP